MQFMVLLLREESLSASMEDLITRLDYRIEANEASSDEDISSILGHLVVVKETYEGQVLLVIRQTSMI